MSKNTNLCIVNTSGRDIVKIEAVVLSPSGFVNPAGFKQALDTRTIAKNDSLGIYVMINEGAPARYRATLTFDDTSFVTFDDDQQNASVKHVGPIDPLHPVDDIQVWRITGGDAGSSSAGTNGIYIRALPVPDNSNWMRDLLTRKPEVRLNDLTMPGSHDAGMYKITGYLGVTPHNPEWVLAQYTNFSLADQLAAGSRFFDIRVRLNNGVLCTAHWSKFLTHPIHFGAYGAILNEVLDDVVAFMRGKEEVVVLKFSHTDMEDEPQIVKPIVQRVKDIVGGAGMLYKAASNDYYAPLTSKLADLKGKVIAVFGQEFKPYWDGTEGIIPYYDVPEEAPNPGGGGDGVTLYDHFAEKGSYTEMSSDQLTKLAEYGGWGNQYQFVLAWTLTGDPFRTKPKSIMDIEVLAGMANPWLPNLMFGIGGGGSHRPGIVSLDFVDPYLCETIIAMNRLTPVNQFQPSFTGGANLGFYYGTGQNGPAPLWMFRTPVFYALPTSEPGNAPVYRYHATSPNHYYLSLDDQSSGHGQNEGPAFYAFANPAPGTVPINQFHKDEDDGNGTTVRTYCYSSAATCPYPGPWAFDKIAFHAYSVPKTLSATEADDAVASHELVLQGQD